MSPSRASFPQRWCLAIAAACATAVGLCAASVPRPNHVVIVMEENHSFSDVIENSEAPYINSLAQSGALFTDSHAVEHPSQPNYLDLFSGSNQGVRNDTCPQTLSAANLGSELIAAGLTFAGYSEDLPATGSTICRVDAYRRRHAPWINFTNVPGDSSLTLTSWPQDLGELPTLSFVIPNLDNDMHNGTIQEADTWLKSHIEAYRDWAMSHNSLLIVTWDEDDNQPSNHIPTIFIGPMVRPGRYTETIDHFSVLRTLEDMYGLPALGESANATPITDVWTADAPRSDCNQNGTADADDITLGTSSDENADAVPDECQTIAGILELVESEPGCVQLVLESEVEIRGGELGILHDGEIVAVDATLEADLDPRALLTLERGETSDCAAEGKDKAGVKRGETLKAYSPLQEDTLCSSSVSACIRRAFEKPSRP